MLTALVFGLAVLPACTRGTDIRANGDVPEDWQLVNEDVEFELSRSKMPGFALAVVKDGEVVWSQGYGHANIKTKLLATGNTPFSLASISKAVTGISVMQAIEEEKLALSDSLDDHMDWSWDNPHVNAASPTIRHLVTHTTGAIDNNDVWGDLGNKNSLYVDGDSDIALGDFMEGYFSSGGSWYNSDNFSDDAPGETYEYCNLTSALAAYTVEAASGTDFAEYSRANLLDPLGLENTGWHLSDFDPDEVAMPYERFGSDFEPYGHYGYPDYPNGGLRASAADLGRILAAMASGGTLDGVQVLESSSVDEMWRVQQSDVDEYQGVFWFWSDIGDHYVVGHNGGEYGTLTDMAYSPESGVGAVVLTNTDEGKGVDAPMLRILELLLDEGS
jgi:CubicO group peptidase (beta-lactamase class C family)